MDGATWASLIQLYVKSINSGQMPDIESSWTNICRSKATQGLATAIEFMQNEFERLILPTNGTDLERLIQDTEKTAVKEMKRCLVGDPEIANDCLSQFDQIFKQKIEELRAQNEMACQESAQQMLV